MENLEDPSSKTWNRCSPIPKHIGTFIAIGVGILLFILIIAAVIALIRYPTETAVMRMVNDYEQTGLRLASASWKMGWSRQPSAWAIDLISAPTCC